MSYGQNQLISAPNGNITTQRFNPNAQQANKVSTPIKQHTAGGSSTIGSEQGYNRNAPQTELPRYNQPSKADMDIYKSQQAQARKMRTIQAGEGLLEMGLATGFMAGLGTGNVPLAVASGVGFLAEQVFKPEIEKIFF